MAPTSVLDRRSQRAVPLILFAVVLALLIARVVVWRMDAAKTGGAEDLVRWVAIEQAETLAAQQNKRILYDFTAAWCVPCHQLRDAVFRNERLARIINDRYIAVQVVDRQQEDGVNDPLVEALEQRFSVRAFPTVIFADSGGNAVQRMEGFGGAERFEQLMEQVP
jgi:thiol:disulfide interchange protein